MDMDGQELQELHECMQCGRPMEDRFEAYTPECERCMNERE